MHDEAARHQLVHRARDRARRCPKELGGLGPALVELRGAVAAEAVDAHEDAERHAGEPERFPHELVDTRNYYTHFSPDRKDKAFGKEELSIVNAELMALLEYHLMLTLGFDDETTLTNVQRRLRNR
ncbi:hypothetical protein K5713_07070 [Trueperella pyogenes]|nr:hypothetical protein K5713_07070 [Trueperella pyogenes]